MQNTTVNTGNTIAREKTQWQVGNPDDQYQKHNNINHKSQQNFVSWKKAGLLLVEESNRADQCQIQWEMCGGSHTDWIQTVLLG